MKNLLFFLLLFAGIPMINAQTTDEERKYYLDSLKLGVKDVIQVLTKKDQRDLIKAVLKEYPEEKKSKEIPDGWRHKGKVGLLINQSAFNAEWSGGGTNNVAGNASLQYDLNYKQQNWTWDNQFRIAYGLSKLEENNDFRKTDDNFEFNSVLGFKARKNWYYSAFTNLKTQLDVGYKFDKEGNRTETSHGFSPAYVQLGLGGLWKESDNLRVNTSPLAGRLIFVHDHFTIEKDAFGVDQGKSTSLEFGASIEGYFKFLIQKKLSIENIISLYSNYLEKPENVDINYTLNIAMPITKNFNTTFAFQAIYDDDTVSGFQIREVLAIGLNFLF